MNEFFVRLFYLFPTYLNMFAAPKVVEDLHAELLIHGWLGSLELVDLPHGVRQVLLLLSCDAMHLMIELLGHALIRLSEGRRNPIEAADAVAAVLLFVCSLVPRRYHLCHNPRQEGWLGLKGLVLS